MILSTGILLLRRDGSWGFPRGGCLFVFLQPRQWTAIVPSNTVQSGIARFSPVSNRVPSDVEINCGRRLWELSAKGLSIAGETFSLSGVWHARRESNPRPSGSKLQTHRDRLQRFMRSTPLFHTQQSSVASQTVADRSCVFVTKL